MYRQIHFGKLCYEMWTMKYSQNTSHFYLTTSHISINVDIYFLHTNEMIQQFGDIFDIRRGVCCPMVEVIPVRLTVALLAFLVSVFCVTAFL